MELIFPLKLHKDIVTDFYNEFSEHGEQCIGSAIFTDFETWLCLIENRRTGEKLPADKVRENFYLCFNSGELIGVLNIKYELNQYLYDFGGHIGYAVRPS